MRVGAPGRSVRRHPRSVTAQGFWLRLALDALRQGSAEGTHHPLLLTGVWLKLAALAFTAVSASRSTFSRCSSHVLPLGYPGRPCRMPRAVATGTLGVRVKQLCSWLSDATTLSFCMHGAVADAIRAVVIILHPFPSAQRVSCADFSG